MLTAILTTSGQNSSAFRRKEKSSETKQQKIESNGWFRLASISCCCCRWRASARCRRTCAERDLQNVTYHNNCYEKNSLKKIHLFIRSPNKRQYLPRSSEIFRTTSRKMRNFRSVKKFLELFCQSDPKPQRPWSVNRRRRNEKAQQPWRKLRKRRWPWFSF